MTTFALVTFGCKVNQYESEKIRYFLSRSGYAAVDDWHEADVIIVNSCVVTQKSEQKNRRLIRKMKRENPAATVITAGCLVEMGPVEGSDAHIGSRDKIARILELLHVQAEGPLTLFSGRTRAFIKIEDGCNQFCSYCIIPLTRGREVYLPVPDILREAQALAENGYREIVLTGIHLGRHPQLLDIIRAVAGMEKVSRLRLSSIEINEVGDELLLLMRDHPKVMPHLHIPLQSGSGTVLRAMNRPYSEEEMIERLEGIRRFLPRGGLTTDIIVGFPQESEEEFRKSEEVILKYAFHRVHLFPFSPRPGTKAFTMEGRPERELVSERMSRMEEAARKGRERFLQMMAGHPTSVLIEKEGPPGNFTGYTPEYLRVTLSGQYALNTVVPVTVNDGLQAREAEDISGKGDDYGDESKHGR